MNFLVRLMSFLLCLGWLTAAHASEPAEAGSEAELTSRDAQHVREPAAVVVPALPEGFVTKRSGWFEISYPAEAAERVAPLVEQADAIKRELSDKLGQPVLSRVTVRVARDTQELAKLSPVGLPPPSYASGVAYHGLDLVLLSMLEPRGAEAVALEQVLRHELSHVALEHATAGRHVPVWFNEGLAIAMSGELAVARTKTLWDATLANTVLPLSELDRRFPQDSFDASIAYAESADFMRFLSRRSDQHRFVALIERVRTGQAFERAVADAYGADLRRLEFEWRGELDRRFSLLPALLGGGTLWGVLALVLVIAYVRRRRRAQAILAQWGREEAREDARLAAIRESLRNAHVLGEPAQAGSRSEAEPAADDRPRVRIVRVGEDGTFQTLH